METPHRARRATPTVLGFTAWLYCVNAILDITSIIENANSTTE
jgi:hypothetical protein